MNPLATCGVGGFFVLVAIAWLVLLLTSIIFRPAPPEEEARTSLIPAAPRAVPLAVRVARRTAPKPPRRAKMRWIEMMLIVTSVLMLLGAIVMSGVSVPNAVGGDDNAATARRR